MGGGDSWGVFTLGFEARVSEIVGFGFGFADFELGFLVVEVSYVGSGGGGGGYGMGGVPGSPSASPSSFWSWSPWLGGVLYEYMGIKGVYVVYGVIVACMVVDVVV